MRILRHLIDARQRVVTRSELKRDFWPNTMRIDTERRLNTVIRALREALGDAAEQPQYIATVRGHGYRWIGPSPTARNGSGRRFASAVTVALVALLSGSTSFKSAANWAPELDTRLVQIAATAQVDSAGAAAGLDQLIRERPGYSAPQILRAQLAMDAWRNQPGAIDLAEVRNAVSRARRIVGGSPEIDALSAELALTADWDWAKAEQLYQRAIAADPHNVVARQGLAWLYVDAGRIPEAWPHIAALLAVTPLTTDLRANLGWLMLRSERADLALDFCSAQSGVTVNLLSCRHTALAQVGAISEARLVAINLLESISAESSVIAAVRAASPEQGYRLFLLWRVDHFLPRGDHWFQRAQLQAEAGQYDAALSSLERAAELRDPSMVKIGTTASFQRLADTPRYKALVMNIFAPGDERHGA